MNENPVGDAPTGAARVDVAERRAWSTEIGRAHV